MKKIFSFLAITSMSMALIAQNTPDRLLPHFDSASQSKSYVQVINIPQGWSGISGFVLPHNIDIEALFQSVIGQLIIVKTLNGAYYPEGQLNTLLNWEIETGYMVKFSQSSSLELEGNIITDKTLSLEAGWNLIPVISSCNVNVTTLFAETDVVLVKEVAGIKLYWPDLGINTLSELLPGKAYLVLLTSAVTVTFPDCEWICGFPFRDERDGQSYNTVQIGNQCWMAENLNIGMRIDGSSDQTNNSIIEKYCYNNSEANCDVYGGLYQGNEMMQYSITPGEQGICPEGWYLPTDADWTYLTNYVSSQPAYICGSNTGNIAKSLATTTNWNNSVSNCAVGNDLSLNNATGFSALPCGIRNTDGLFYHQGNATYWWSSSPGYTSNAWYRYMFYDYTSVYSLILNKSYGFSVRCLKDG